jgi:molybdopterin converting factor small subunit
VTVTFQLAGFLRSFAGGAREVRLDVPGRTVQDALLALAERHPGVSSRVLDEQGVVRRHVNVFVGDLSIRDTGGLATPLRDGSTISLLAAVSGG